MSETIEKSIAQIEAMPTYRLLKAMQSVIKARWDSIDKENLGDDGLIDKLFSEDGYTPPNYEPSAGQSNALAAGFQLLDAYQGAESFAEHCAVIFHGRRIDNGTKADWCRSLSWHYTYLLRERAISFVNTLCLVMKPEPRCDDWRTTLAEEIRVFKKATDKELTDRGKHVHNYSIDDPHAAQIKFIELMTNAPDQREFWERMLKWRQRAVRKQIREKTRMQLRSMMDHTNSLLIAAEPVWAVVYEALRSFEEKRSAA